jgi:uncharacterized protein
MLVQIKRPQPLARFAGLPPQTHVFETATGFHALIVDGSRVYSIDESTAQRLQSAGADAVLKDLGLTERTFVDDQTPETIAVRSLSLAVAQKCNLACTYCYAQEGSFGVEPRNMDEATARRAVELLFDNARPGESVNLAFLGGEPIVNRALIVTCTKQAAMLGCDRNVRVNFSVTTNGTVITPEDGAFFEKHGFAVTISLDGVGEVHDRLRPFRGGEGRGSSRECVHCFERSEECRCRRGSPSHRKSSVSKRRSTNCSTFDFIAWVSRLCFPLHPAAARWMPRLSTS